MKELSFSKDGRLLTDDPQVSGIFDDVQQIIAPSELNVMIEGETGTGKEGVAQAIHFYSSRKKGSFVDVNCATIPESLAESSLFGHTKGSFTGADKSHKGYFEQANGGTIFLDEIGSLSHDNQARLLRVLQQGEVRRVGATKQIKVNVRVITAGNTDLLSLVEDGKFRNDLYFRLAAAPITLSPLRERQGDIELLTGHFLARFRNEFKSEEMTIASDTMRLLYEYDWPGNVRELENAIRYAVMMAKGKGQNEIDSPHLPLLLKKKATVHASAGQPKSSFQSVPTKNGNTRQALLRLLKLRSPRKIGQLAVEIKKDRSTIYKHLKRMAEKGQVKMQSKRGREGSLVSLCEEVIKKSPCKH